MSSTPSPPDPIQTATAQGKADVQTTIASGVINNPNEVNPYGSVTYTRSGKEIVRNPNGTRTPVPRYTKTVTLSDAEQAKLDATNTAQLGLLDLANTQIDRVSDVLSDPYTGQSDIARVGSVKQPTLKKNYNADMAQTGNFYTPARNDYSANMVNESFGKVPVAKKNVDIQLMGGAGSDRVNELNRKLNTGEYVTNYMPGGGEFSADAFSQDRDKFVEAIYSRLDPQMDKDRAEMETKLAAQGLVPGTEQFNNAMDELRRAETDARYQAELYGGQEQSRLLGEARSAAGFTNDALTNAFVQENAATGQALDQQLARKNFNLNAVTANNQARLAQQQAYNQGIGQDYAQRLGALGYEQGAITSNNAARLGEQQAYNQSAMQDYTQQLGNATYNSNIINQNNQARLAGMQANNSAKQQQFSNALDAAAFQNSSRSADLQEQLATRNQPLNEIAAAMSGSPVNIPQFQNYARQAIPSPPVADSIYSSYALEAQNAANANAGLFGIGSAFMGAIPLLASDKRLKEDVKRVGKTDKGLPIYSYKYKDDPKGLFHLGAMAQEAKKTQPKAVGKMPGGMLGIDYSKIR